MSLSGPKSYTAVPRIRPRGPRAKLKDPMKPTLKQRFYNWLTNSSPDMSMSQDVQMDTINSNGLRFNLYKASGGYVIEIRSYDERTDRNTNKLYVITEDKDLGVEIGKIITMESLR